MKTLILALVSLLVQGSAVPAGSASEYVVGPHDVLEIVVYGHGDLSSPRLPVDSDGTIDFPTLGRLVVAGKSAREIEEELKKHLLGKQILTNVSMTVTVKEFRSQTVHVMGQVRTQGIFPIKGGGSMVATAIAEAGGFLDNAGSHIIIVRNTGNPDSPARVDAAAAKDKIVIQRAALEEARAESRIPLRHGDTIFVPKAEVFYISGQVKNPGEYVLRPNLTVGMAITLAQGYTDRANKKPEITRMVKGKVVKVKARETDLVRPNDQIHVGSRWW